MNEPMRDEVRDRRIELAENEAPVVDAQKPVAYDANGQPLYAAPPTEPGVPTQVVHVARATEPIPVEVSDETRQRHEESKRKYPWLNLSEHEYVIASVPRHGIGLWMPLAAVIFFIALIFVGIFTYPDIASIANLPMSAYGMVIMVGLLLVVACIFGGYLAMWVYTNNRFFLTNESVIQEIQITVFSKREQTVSLMNVEDASFAQKGVLQTMLDFGSIRLSTEGDETTYRFDYVRNPKYYISILNNAVEAFKNGRPVDVPPSDDD